MISGKTGAVGRELEALWTSGTLTGLSDAQLLSRFAETRDALGESAFRELIERHGPMVLGVCRQILRHPHDADDAFQATFLVLVRKARSIRVDKSLAPWLYAVAYRTAQRARAIAARYCPAGVEPMEEPMRSPADEAYPFDLRPLLHEELNRLPGKYREPIVLCHLQGKTHEEAARLLHWPVGTVSGRLSRGRLLLRSRLERRGVTVSSAMLSANWLAGTPTALTLPLLESTLSTVMRFAAGQAVSTSVLSLSQGVLRTMLFNKIRTISLALLLLSAASRGVGVWAFQASPPPSRPNPAAEPIPPKVEAKAAVPALDPQFQPQQQPVGTGVFRTTSVILVESPDRTALEAMSLDTSDTTWRRLAIPPGTTATPLSMGDTVALIIKGKTIDQIAAFSAYTGVWAVQGLLKPVEGQIIPLIGPGSALYQAGNDFYAFSAQKGTWGVLRLEGGEKGQSLISPTHIEVWQGNAVRLQLEAGRVVERCRHEPQAIPPGSLSAADGPGLISPPARAAESCRVDVTHQMVYCYVGGLHPPYDP
jgi:RNA polymerase sigma factor (sigma-70 family)